MISTVSRCFRPAVIALSPYNALHALYHLSPILLAYCSRTISCVGSCLVHAHHLCPNECTWYLFARRVRSRCASSCKSLPRCLQPISLPMGRWMYLTRSETSSARARSTGRIMVSEHDRGGAPGSTSVVWFMDTSTRYPKWLRLIFRFSTTTQDDDGI